MALQYKNNTPLLNFILTTSTISVLILSSIIKLILLKDQLSNQLKQVDLQSKDSLLLFSAKLCNLSATKTIMLLMCYHPQAVDPYLLLILHVDPLSQCCSEANYILLIGFWSQIYNCSLQITIIAKSSHAEFLRFCSEIDIVLMLVSWCYYRSENSQTRGALSAVRPC